MNCFRVDGISFGECSKHTLPSAFFQRYLLTNSCESVNSLVVYWTKVSHVSKDGSCCALSTASLVIFVLFEVDVADTIETGIPVLLGLVVGFFIARRWLFGPMQARNDLM